MKKNPLKWTQNNVIWRLRLIYLIFMVIPALMTRFVFPNVGPLTPQQVDKMFLVGIIADAIFYTPTFVVWLYLIERFKKYCIQTLKNASFDESSFKKALDAKRTLFLLYIPLNVISVILVSISGVYYLLYVLKETDITLEYSFNFVLTILAFVLIFILFALLIIEFLTSKYILLTVDVIKIAKSNLDEMKSVSLKTRGYFVAIVSSLSIIILVIGGLSDKISIEEMIAVFLFLIIYLFLILALFSQSISPIITLQDELRKLLQGKLISGERVPIQSFDETGTLAQLYNLFLSKFYGSLNQLQEEAQRLNKIINDYQETFDGVMTQISEINTALSNYSTATQEISDNTQTTSEFLNNLVGLIETWGTSIFKLTAKFKEIVVQIKILSLNTAIEAAREGQTKGGFAIIAQNIRESSDTLQEINKEIVKLTTQLREQILQDAQDVKTSLEENVALIEENASQIEEITATLEEITAMVEQLRQQTIDIAKVSDNLTKVVAQYLSELDKTPLD